VRLAPLLSLVLLGGAAACTSETSEMTADPGFEATVQPLFDLACNCHQSEPLLAPFSLRPGEAYANLVDRPSMQLSTMLLVAPGSLNESYLWLKVNDTQAEVGGMGTIMPPTIPLTADQRGVLERWIAAGAPP
jgi:hypothetical protein